jgi:hypothetical protein
LESIFFPWFYLKENRPAFRRDYGLFIGRRNGRMPPHGRDWRFGPRLILPPRRRNPSLRLSETIWRRRAEISSRPAPGIEDY